MRILPALLAIFFATSTAAEPNDQIETITVTGHRLPTTDNVLPVQIRAPKTGPGVGADALRNLPSLAISQAGSLGSVTQVRIRGAEANHLLVLMDGVELTDPATDSSYNFANFTLSGSNHLELLAGSHSAVWGSDALAGVLNIATVPVSQIRRLDIEAGAFDTRHANLQFADRGETFYYNLSLADFSTDGTNIAVADEGSDEKDGFQQQSLLFSAGFTRDDWSVSTLLRHMTSRADFDPTPFPSFQPRDGDNESDHDESVASLTVDWRGHDRLEQRLQLSYFETENRSYADDRRESTTAAERTKATSLTRFRADGRQTLTLLLEHEKESFEQSGTASFFGDPNQQQAVETTSAALEYLANPTARLALTASARHDHNTDFDNSQSFRAGLKYQLREELQLWASWGTGIKNPSFVERFGFTPDTFFGNDALKPESNRHLSAGLRYHPGTWSLAATLFRDRLKDEINGFTFDANLGGFTSANEVGRSQRDGAELEISADFTYASVALGVSYLSAEEPDGATEIRRPDWQGFVTVRHENGPLAAELSAFHVDDQDDFDFSTFPANRVSLDAYTLLRAHVSYQLSERLNFALRGENLLDEDYQDQLGYSAPGRAVYLQLGVEI
jgi:vitamin B12 transporter